MNFLLNLIGQEDNVNTLQISVRAVVVFLYSLGLLRLAGRRAFGMHATFDNITAILLGAILARAVVGASPFIPTLIAGLVLAILHRVFALLSVSFPWLGRWIKGKPITLIKKGVIQKQAMVRSLISKHDLEAVVRDKTHQESMETIESAYLERDGSISLIKKTKH